MDRFASSHNAQVERFNCRFWNPGTEAVDAFTVNWAGENNWWCPPVSLVPRVLSHARNCQCSGTLIVPVWRSAVFWPMLCPNGTDLSKIDQEMVVLSPAVDLILPGQAGAQLFKGDMPNTDLLAVRLN